MSNVINYVPCSARYIDEHTENIEVIEVMDDFCQSCGMCVVSCPAGAKKIKKKTPSKTMD